jgi:Peptidase S24-like
MSTPKSPSLYEPHDRMFDVTGDPSTDFGLPGRRHVIFRPGAKPKVGWYVAVKLRGKLTVRLFENEIGHYPILVPLNKNFPAEKSGGAEILGRVICISVGGR